MCLTINGEDEVVGDGGGEKGGERGQGCALMD